MPIICTLGPNVLIREFAIERLEPVLASQATKALLAKELYAPILAMIVAHAGPRNTWLPRLIEFTLYHGTP
jgi:hypothetical protein